MRKARLVSVPPYVPYHGIPYMANAGYIFNIFPDTGGRKVRVDTQDQRRARKGPITRKGLLMIQKYTDLELRVRDFGRTVARREEGATAVEYGLLVALIAVAIIGAVFLLGGTLNTIFTNVEGSID